MNQNRQAIDHVAVIDEIPVMGHRSRRNGHAMEYTVQGKIVGNDAWWRLIALGSGHVSGDIRDSAPRSQP